MPRSSPAAEHITAQPDKVRLSRRSALRQLALIGAWGALPWDQVEAVPAPLPDPSLLSQDPERFWTKLRAEQFYLPEDRVYLNPGSLGVPSRSVVQRMLESVQRGSEYATDQIERWGYEPLDKERSEMAEFLGCTKDELAFTHNCTEAMSTVANGLDLKAGDEVIMTNQEHGGGSCCWRLKAARFGISVREVEIPLSPKHRDDLMEPLISAIGPRTRVLSFSGITSPTGLILPVQEICRAARDKGVMTVVDGAHMDGQVPVNVHELGCDYFAGSPHKWMFAAAGCGLLYGRGDGLDRLWPTVVTSGWDNKAELHASRLMMVGTNNRATIEGMMEGLRFMRRLGPEVIYARTHQLAKQVLEQAQRRKYLEVVTPNDPQFFHAIVAMRCNTDKSAALAAALQAHNINAIAGQKFRISTHIHCRPSDIEKLFAVCDSVLGQ